MHGHAPSNINLGFFCSFDVNFIAMIHDSWSADESARVFLRSIICFVLSSLAITKHGQVFFLLYQIRHWGNSCHDTITNVTNMKTLKGISRMWTISFNGFLNLLVTSTINSRDLTLWFKYWCPKEIMIRSLNCPALIECKTLNHFIWLVAFLTKMHHVP